MEPYKCRQMPGEDVTDTDTADPSPSPSPSSCDTGCSPQDWKCAVLCKHNELRAKHSASPLTWDEGLAESSQRLADQCQLAHSTGRNYGENVAGMPGSINTTTPTIGDIRDLTNAVQLWYNEQTIYANKSQTGAPFVQWGHFTQVVWKDTTNVGCAYKSCLEQNNMYPGTNRKINGIFVCQYTPPGNFAGRYESNVQANPSS